ncbi:hypothetical protein KIH41_13265 [Litoribacter ruber]|uniref:hypothetical protein n=1 Tax=Litoribacter ruber TaxID=702568 RepID=UPI001BDB6498|nr:hypothetical protein [Litoribacter ruber]MBT0812249.1 hypothetical protein [Litoribacter ruber]
MKRVTLQIPDDQYHFFLELVQKLGLERVDEEAIETKEETLQGIEQGLRQVKLIKEGKMKGSTLKDFLNEL